MRWFRTLLMVIFLPVSVALAGCQQDSAVDGPTSVSEAAPAKKDPTESSRTETDASSSKKKMEEMLKSHARKRDIVIGGCRRDCESHKESFKNYVYALLKRDQGASSIPFLETSEMVFNQDRLGDGWVDLWKRGQMADRRESIAEFARRVSSWVDGVDDAAVERALATGIEWSEDDEPGYLIFFRHPIYKGDSTSSVWKYRIQKRGWEWLVSEIDFNFQG